MGVIIMTKSIIIKNGLVIDPLNNINDKKDIYIENGIIVSHEPKIEGFVDKVIRIEKKNHISKHSK